MQQKSIQVNDIELAYFERGTPRDDRPSLFFVHATGFHARVWDYHAEQFPDHHIIAIDQRGHGRSSKVSVRHWGTFGEDQAAFVQALGLRDLIGIGHSMGAHGMLEGAARSGAFRRLLLLDPTVAGEQMYAEQAEPVTGEPMHPAVKRRRTFASADEMYDQLRGKSSFPLFTPRTLRDYCNYGVEPAEGGGVVLCCEPEVEAWVYMTARSNGEIYNWLRSLQIPVTVVRAKLPTDDAVADFSSSPTWPELASVLPVGRDLHWPDCSHFLPMQRPDDVVALIAEEIKAWHG